MVLLQALGKFSLQMFNLACNLSLHKYKVILRLEGHTCSREKIRADIEFLQFEVRSVTIN